MGAEYWNTLIKFPVMALPSIHNIQALIIHDVIIVSMFMFLITTPLFKSINFLKWCGEHSLTLYLTHLLFLAASMQIAIAHFDVDQVTGLSMLVVLGIFMFSPFRRYFMCYVFE